MPTDETDLQAKARALTYGALQISADADIIESAILAALQSVREAAIREAAEITVDRGREGSTALPADFRHAILQLLDKPHA